MRIAEALADSCAGVYKFAVFYRKYKRRRLLLQKKALMGAVENILIMRNRNNSGIAETGQNFPCYGIGACTVLYIYMRKKISEVFRF